jgi:hypothetical protein
MTAPADNCQLVALYQLQTISFSNGLTGGCLISGTSNLSFFCNTKRVWWNCNRNVDCNRQLWSCWLVSRTITISPAALPTMTAPADTTLACGALPAQSHFLMD